MTKERRKAKNRSASKAYYNRDLERGRERGRAQFAALSPERVLQYSLKKFNITVELYQALLVAQNHCCAICGKHESENSGKRLSVDHDHSCCPKKSTSCGKCVRGLLCIGCNSGLGHLQDSLRVVISAASYLEKYR